ncbi:MAG: [FeFe] hydrogenase, group A [Rhizomicrobium sp.]|jgi:ferredoxin hydrogenase gamma subunit
MDTDNSAEAANIVHATINGVAVEGQKNETILHCARRYDIYIPTLCELDDIDHTPGTCRICLVEIQIPGQSRSHLVTSCNTPLLNGMDVQTRSPRARAAQRLQVELIMADHNQDCATCTRHGDCELQDVAQFVGLRKNRFVDLDRINTREIDISSPAMIRDMTKCIRCQRCVAVCRDGQGVDALVMTGTGENTAVGLRNGLSQKDSDCVTCGQCVLVCPTGAIGERDETDKVSQFLYDPDIITVFQFAPALRVAFGEEFGLPPGTNVQGQIVAACRKLGADIVLDTNFGADLVIMEESAELLRRLGEKKRPTFTSCCPAWINFAEQLYPDILPLLSSTKSPMQCLGVIAKTYLPEKMGIDPKRIRVVALMPCTAKKDEAARQQLQFEDMAEIDVVLTTREFAHLLRSEGIDLGKLEPAEFDNPYMSEFSGAGAIFGTTGGVMEAAVRTMYFVINGKELDKIELEQLRGFDGVRSATVDMGGPVGLVKVAMCHGLKPVRQIVEAVRSGEADFDFIEIMACPGGCVDGGGSLRSKKAYLPHALRRRSTLFNIDRQQKARQSHNNKQIQTLYHDFLEKPYSDKAHHLLHTVYNDRKLTLTRTVKEIWQEITMSTMVY